VGVREWIRRWEYTLVWQDGHDGRRNGFVDTVEQLGAVVAWARANPRVRRWSFRPVQHLEGEPEWADVGPCGHRLVTYPHPYRRDGWLPCRDDGGHSLRICPTCEIRIIEPVPGPDCGPPDGWAPP
jgi:hypothetical protein